MSSKTKIVVLHMKEIIYTIIISVLIILLAVLFFFMFSSKNQEGKTSAQVYTPGIYTSAIKLNNTNLAVEVVVDSEKVQSIRIQNLDESVTAMYPLLQPTLENIADQICAGQSLDDIALSDDTPYTSRLLINAIEEALNQASAAAKKSSLNLLHV